MNHLSPWEEDIRRRLADHRATPPIMGWEKLSEKLRQDSPASPIPAKRRLWRRPAFLVTALSAAACMTLVALLTPDRPETDIRSLARQAPVPTDGNGRSATAPQGRITNTVAQKATHHYAAPASRRASAAAAVAEATPRPAGTAEKFPALQTAALPAATPPTGTAENEVATPTENGQPSANARQMPDRQAQQKFRRPVTNSTLTARASSGKRHLALSLHANALQGDLDLHGGYASTMAASYAAIGTQSSPAGKQNALNSLLYENLNRKANTRVNHHTPIQLGLSVAWALDERWSLGTGLTYTRLSTEIISGSHASYYVTDQRLHYIGVPLQVRFTALATRYIDLYLSGGGMLEKCVSGIQTTTYNVSKSYKSQNDSPQHLGRGLWQASLNASAGFQANITRSVGLYFEPGLTWYANDGSSLPNIRHDKPWQFTMQGGLRYTFGR